MGMGIDVLFKLTPLRRKMRRTARTMGVQRKLGWLNHAMYRCFAGMVASGHYPAADSLTTTAAAMAFFGARRVAMRAYRGRRAAFERVRALLARHAGGSAALRDDNAALGVPVVALLAMLCASGVVHAHGSMGRRAGATNPTTNAASNVTGISARPPQMRTAEWTRLHTGRRTPSSQSILRLARRLRTHAATG
jgi:hypothetical protein